MKKNHIPSVRKLLLWTGMLVLVFLMNTGCGEKSYKPAAIKDGVDKCTVCSMLIKDDAHATEIILKDEKALKFDDLGDLFAWLKKNGEDQVAAQYVRDYHSKNWVELSQATFVYDPSIQTPMAYGVVSFEKEADADAFLKEKAPQGKKLKAADLSSFNWEHTHPMTKGEGHQMDMNK